LHRGQRRKRIEPTEDSARTRFRIIGSLHCAPLPVSGFPDLPMLQTEPGQAFGMSRRRRDGDIVPGRPSRESQR
jgi:hypothetical protein